MNGQPLISIVTPSFNQGRYIRETLQSLVDQNYPNLEVVIQDGGSTDGAIAVAQEFVDRYPKIFQLFVEKDTGQSDALNRGFARTRGEILGFLNSDDTLFPGCLRRVACEIDPGKNRYLVLGRCVFTGEGSIYVGSEHPSFFVNHFEQLAIWKRGHNTIPQPSVFWHRQVWEKCGHFDVNEGHALDYDLFCRFSQYYRFHSVDEIWSTYRMHSISKSAQRTEAEILNLCIKVSQRYWGSWLRPLRWRCEFSYWLYGHHHHESARHHARRCEEAAVAKQRLRTVIEFARTAFHSPKMARERLLVPFLTGKRLGFLQRMLINPHGGFTGRYDADQWVGPLYRHNLTVPKDAVRLVLILQHSPQGENHRTVNVVLQLDRKVVARKQFSESGQAFIEADIQAWQGRDCLIELRSDNFFVPRSIHKVPDDRRLSIQLLETRLETVEDGFTGRYKEDSWIGPLYREELTIPARGRRLLVVLQHSPQGGKPQTVKTDLYLDQLMVATGQYTKPGQYTLEVDVSKTQGRHCTLEIRSNNYWVPRMVHNIADDRRLSLQLIDVRVENTAAGFTGRYDGDSYIGPHYYQELTIPLYAVCLSVNLQHKHQGKEYQSVTVTLYLNGEAMATAHCTTEGNYLLEADLRTLQGLHGTIELRSDNFFVPRIVHNAPDDRKLSVQLIETRIEPTAGGFTGRYDADAFIGPHFSQTMEIPAQADQLVLVLRHTHQGERYRDVKVTLLINGQAVTSQHCAEPGLYSLVANLTEWQGGHCVIEVRSDNFFTPRSVHNVSDDRQLSIQLLETRIEAATVPPPKSP